MLPPVSYFEILQYICPKIYYISNIFGKVEVIKASAGFKLTTNRFVANALTQCSILLGKNFGKENTCYPYHLNCMIKKALFFP